MKVNVVSRKLVKPCNPTPAHLRTYKISLLDETNPSINHMRLLYFSSSNDGIDAKFVCLEESLSQILPNFYPLAGRYNEEKREVDCNDEGAHYSTADVYCELSQIVGAEVEPEQLNRLLPVDIAAADEPTDPMLAIQINRYRCGGLAIGVCASHRIIDSAAFALFLTAWGKAAASGGELLIQPHFDTHSYFPAQNLPPIGLHDLKTSDKIVAKRYVFDSKAIQKLRKRLSSEWESIDTDRPPSRMVTVSAFLTQALLSADKARHGKPRAAVVGVLIDIRERTVPAVPKHTFGTWISGSFLELTAAESEAQNFPGLAAKLWQTTAQGVRDCARVLSDKEFGRKVLVENFFEATKKGDSSDCKVIWVTDISKFGEYDVDFGFGKPVWVSAAAVPLQDHIFLFNNKSNDGIEAWLSLLESDMQFFLQNNKEIPLLTAT